MAGSSASAVFDPEHPQRFYLPDEEMERLADGTLVVEGVQLPVHRAVLGLQSRVLRGMFVDLLPWVPRSQPTVHLLSWLDSGWGRGRKHKQPEEQVVLEQPFDDCRLLEVAAFLSCAYRRSRLAALPAGCLPGVLRLAHRLDASEILDAVTDHMTKAADSGAATTQELLTWADAADACNLDELRSSCVAEVARQLAADMDSLPTGADGLLSTFTHTSLLEGCSQRTVLLLLRIMTAAGKKPHLRCCIPSKDAVAEALQRAPNVGAFEWALERFSEQPSAVRREVRSPWFTAAGKEWRIGVFPGGETDAEAGHLSVFLMPKSAARAKFKLTVIAQSRTASQSVAQHASEPITIKPIGLGFGKFMALEQLRTRGYLANDRLVVRAEVEVVPE